MARKINQKGIEKLKAWEGLVLYTYDDADDSTPKKRVVYGTKVKGKLTIGYGHTKGVKPGMNCTEEQAEQWLREDLAEFEARVAGLVTVPLTDNQFAALVSFDFNTGALHKATLLKRLNAGEYDAVPSELAKWVKTTIAGKKVTSSGLVNRRAAEAGLWAAGAQVASASAPAAPIAPPVITKENLTFGAGLLASMAALFDGTGPVQWALGVVIFISFLTGLGFLIHSRVKAG